MAKRKRKKKIKNNNYTYRIIGIVLSVFALAGIVSLSANSPVGRIAYAIGAFLYGQLAPVFLLQIFALGIYLVVKAEKPNFFNKKLVGIYLLVLGLITLFYLKALPEEGIFLELLKEESNQLIELAKGTILSSKFEALAGGIIGLLMALSLQTLLGTVIAQITTYLLMVVALIIIFDKYIANFFTQAFAKIKEGLSNRPKKESKENEEFKKPSLEEKKAERTAVESLEELKSIALKKGERTSPSTAIAPETPKKKDGKYVLPPLSILDDASSTNLSAKQQNAPKYAKILENVLDEFGITGKVIDYHIGPSVTQYELELSAGTKLSRLVSINKEISLALAKKDVRIQAPIPGKSTVGIEIANDKITPVTLKEVLLDETGSTKDSKLYVALGKNIMGKSKFMEIDETPHLLVAGATGSGKSVCINSIIASILMRATPEEVQLIMIDPKRVELNVYEDIPHLLSPVVTDPKKANRALQEVVKEMENRYKLFNIAKVKSIKDYNKYIAKKNPKGEDVLPYIVVVVDELADLMLVASREVEDSIMRITQMARAAGIHLIIATQRPSTDVITGLVKSNIPSRISFAVSSSIDSRTILDASGAEKLLGKGDMLYFPMGASTPERIQGTFVSDGELKRLVSFIKNQQTAEYSEDFVNIQTEDSSSDMDINKEDPIYDEVLNFVTEKQTASTSLIQRRFKVGYNRASNIMDLLEARGVVSAQEGSKAREVLISNPED